LVCDSRGMEQHEATRGVVKRRASLVESSSSWRDDWECLVNAFVRMKLGSWTVRSVRVLCVTSVIGVL
jgi:hypothetical protein